jgi:hypothetical protein
LAVIHKLHAADEPWKPAESVYINAQLHKRHALNDLFLVQGKRPTEIPKHQSEKQRFTEILNVHICCLDINELKLHHNIP